MAISTITPMKSTTADIQNLNASSIKLSARDAAPKSSDINNFVLKTQKQNKAQSGNSQDKYVGTNIKTNETYSAKTENPSAKKQRTNPTEINSTQTNRNQNITQNNSGSKTIQDSQNNNKNNVQSTVNNLAQSQADQYNANPKKQEIIPINITV